MLEYIEEIEVRKETHHTGNGLLYTVLSNKKGIGSIEEIPSKSPWNWLLKFLTLRQAVSREVHIRCDNEPDLLLYKSRGYYKDIFLYSASELIGTIQPEVKVKSPKMTVFDKKGRAILKALGKFGATDFSVYSDESVKCVGTIKKRSAVYQSMKDNLLKEDHYFLDIRHLSYEEKVVMIGMTLALDLYF
ncbi:hypothetical protein [Anaerobacillus sp. 1_MG-2023]|uniref:hypothetical protein n=1 Tax=Anaerobacillus sp. 1_MG-2023 TaxID=3062655 RepID=UPI0026E412CB|nr:hypothetical protein [Anaerobacillus sp. 1_MG-2023]MDO6654869.1 hypothetical protein [Anaerobacillus sp. 1_MG-2023]